jgi:hypothetical protein
MITFYTTLWSHLCYGSCEERMKEHISNEVLLRRIGPNLRDTHNSDLAAPQMAIQITITSYTTRWNNLSYGL